MYEYLLGVFVLLCEPKRKICLSEKAWVFIKVNSRINSVEMGAERDGTGLILMLLRGRQLNQNSYNHISVLI